MTRAWWFVVFSACILILPFPTRKDIANNNFLSFVDQRRVLPQEFGGGFGGFFSSLFWVESIFELAEVIVDDSAGTHLPFLLHQTCELDTLWAYPRLASAWIISEIPGYSNRDALPFLEDGATRFPDEPRFRLTWAMYVLGAMDLDTATAYDSAVKVLLPLSKLNHSIPEYARVLAFTLLQKSGKAEHALDALVQTYHQAPDPLIRSQFVRKIGDLLLRNKVSLDSDSAAFLGGIGSMLNAGPIQAAAAKDLLIRMVQPETKDAAVLEARQLAQQFREYQSTQLGETR